MYKIVSFVAAFVATLAACGSTVASAQAPITTQAVRIWITAGSFTDIGEAEARRRLGLLIADVDTIFGQQSRRRFSFNPATDVTVMPEGTVLGPPCTIDTVDTSVQIAIFDSVGFGGTYSSAPHRSSLGGCITMNAVTHLHDPSNLAADTDRYDYLAIQLRGLVHEFEHTFGAGLGEYYELTNVNDTTGIAPRIDVNYLENYPDQPTDPYWSRHLEYSGDPLMTIQYANPRVGSPMTRDAVIAATRFTRGTLAWVDTDWPGMKPSVDPLSPLLVARNAVNVKLVDRSTGLPVTATGGAVQVFRFSQSFLGTASPFLLRGAPYDPSTPWTFAWGGTFGGFAFGESRVLVKASAPGYLPSGTWFTIFDLSDQVFVDGRSTVQITVPMSAVSSPLPDVTLVSPAVGSPVENAGFNNVLTFDVSASQGLRQLVVQTPDGFPVCSQYFPPNVSSQRVACAAFLSGATGGTVDVIATVTDQAGRTNAPRTFGFTLVDTQGPGLLLIPSWGPTVLNSREPTQALIQWFDVSGVDRYQLTMGSQVICAATVPLVGDPAQALCPWTAPRIPDNTMSTATLTLTAWDRLGNVSSTSGTVTIDSLPPTLRVISPIEASSVAAGTDVTFVLDVADAGGMDSVEIIASGQTLCFTMDAPFSCVVTIPADWDGGKSFKVNAYDSAMNKTTVEVDLNVLKAAR